MNRKVTILPKALFAFVCTAVLCGLVLADVRESPDVEKALNTQKATDTLEAPGPQQALGPQDTWYGLPSYYAPDGDLPRMLFEKVCDVPKAGELPAAFKEEVIDPTPFGSAESYAYDSVVGIYWPQGLQKEEGAIHEMLSNNGWVRIGLTDAGGSYIKASGHYQWMNVSISTVGDSVTAVFVFTKQEE